MKTEQELLKAQERAERKDRIAAYKILNAPYMKRYVVTIHVPKDSAFDEKYLDRFGEFTDNPQEAKTFRLDWMAAQKLGNIADTYPACLYEMAIKEVRIYI